MVPHSFLWPNVVTTLKDVIVLPARIGRHLLDVFTPDHCNFLNLSVGCEARMKTKYPQSVLFSLLVLNNNFANNLALLEAINCISNFV